MDVPSWVDMKTVPGKVSRVFNEYILLQTEYTYLLFMLSIKPNYVEKGLPS